MVNTLELRSEMMNQGVRGLFLINGGAAVALLAFLQQIWNTNQELVAPILSSLEWLVYGVIVTATVNFARSESSRIHDLFSGGRAKKVTQVTLFFLDRALFLISIACFVVAMWLLLGGVRAVVAIG
jgi:hypothetical protein